MALVSQFGPAGLSLGAGMFWGTSDFVGGYAVRRTNTFLFTMITHASGTILMVSLALLHHSAFPSQTTAIWALAAGVVAGTSLAIFYYAMAVGKMGLTAPVAAVLGAAIPAAITMVTEGLPSTVTIAGFLLAGAGLWLISRPEAGVRPEGLGFALLSGIGFAGYFLCIKQAGVGSALWIAGLSRTCSFVVTAVVVFSGRRFRGITPASIGMATFAGCVDVSGSVLFVRATQAGRLDTVVVLSSLYPAVTVLLAWLLLREHFSRWKVIGMVATIAAVPMIALQ
jgi:drug/metabolite transporter (DMT)-like permease